jgi:cysteine synthase
MKANSIINTIGNTPHIRINKLFPDNYEVWIKLEKNNPGGSIKDRIALSMIEDAEKSNVLKKDSVIIEPTSGNTGIGLAMVAAVKGYKLILVMPESMSIERRRLMSVFGAEFVLTPRENGMKGAIEKAGELVESTPGAWMPAQFENPANPAIHFETTAKEIAADFPEGLDYIITGVGTGGHISGVGRYLKSIWPNLKVYAVEPQLSPVLGGGNPGPHPLQGIGAGFIPQNFDHSVVDGIIAVSKDDAFQFARRLALEEAIFAGVSTGASLAAIQSKLPEIPSGARILTFNYDTGERYLSVEGLWEIG